MLNIKRKYSITVLTVLFFVIHSQAQKINQFDANGKRTGVWKKFYKNNKLRYQGQFKNGKEVGVFKFYAVGSPYFPSITKDFSKASDSAFVKFYTPKGKVKSEGYMLGKNRVGEWKYYFSNGKIFSIENYAEGKLQGLLKNYYPNGKVTEETHYENGKKNGLSKVYTDDGTLLEELTFKDNVLNGPAKYYDLKGQIKESGAYKDGERHGEWEFYVDGEPTSERPKQKTYSIKRN
ncbi:hypothetical protein WH52_05625 [Tenacibaculum holothuriorum]|uniref:Preprotein translocase YidC n=1 Tax=Tenacibaculum holothuriorum TaxID=1635173 RepID=A0A1Y2PF20_9FLAO|nr:toxin-antitoxin system YwqK family antitoxin [Tenacibaculum holothuriorum]OSY88258.1 hypothetical protein WH52_05625 [Tenacibaculum holothuriorum]